MYKDLAFGMIFQLIFYVINCLPMKVSLTPFDLSFSQPNFWVSSAFLALLDQASLSTD